MRTWTIKFLPLLFLLTAACVYRQDIPQGNFFKEEDVAKLEAGMTREQVQFVMGTPMIADPFQPNRWDYLLYVDSQEDARDFYKRVTVFFSGDTVERIETEGLNNAETPSGEEGITLDEDVEQIEEVEELEE